ncbi:MAG TPA: ABC transporter permease [Microcella sp.]|nr:ABC transporter permease [Microcella sp.]
MSALGRAVHAELLRVFSLRSWWILAAVLALYVAVTAGGFAFFVSADTGGGPGPLPADIAAPLVYSSTTSVALVVPLLFGALLATTEYRWRTLTPTLLAQPRRGVVLAGRVVVAALLGALYGVVGALASLAAGAPVLAAMGTDPLLGDPEVLGLLARTVLACALWSLLGLGLGALLTSQVAAIVIVLVFTQFIEPTLRIVAGLAEWSAEAARYLPGAATDSLVGAGILASIGQLDPTIPGAIEPLTMLEGGLVLAALSLVVIVIAAATTLRRDVD